MASPFRMFRKNQKVMMAVITVLAMFAFVFMGSWSKMGGPSNEIQNPEVFTWKYGTVRRSDIQNQRYLRQMCMAIPTVIAAGSRAKIRVRRRCCLSRYFPSPTKALFNR